MCLKIHFLLLDVDECERPWTQCDNVTSSCRNTIGDYQCDCLQGYEQGDSVYECVGEWLWELMLPNVKVAPTF